MLRATVFAVEYLPSMTKSVPASTSSKLLLRECPSDNFPIKRSWRYFLGRFLFPFVLGYIGKVTTRWRFIDSHVSSDKTTRQDSKPDMESVNW